MGNSDVDQVTAGHKTSSPSDNFPVWTRAASIKSTALDPLLTITPCSRPQYAAHCLSKARQRCPIVTCVLSKASSASTTSSAP